MLAGPIMIMITLLIPPYSWQLVVTVDSFLVRGLESLVP